MTRLIRFLQAILYKMREKAFHIYSQFRTGNSNASKVLLTDKPDYGDDELALFGGQTRVLVTKLLNSSNKKRKTTSTSTTVSTPSSDSSESRATSVSAPDPTREVHPSLVEYLSMFPPLNISCQSSPDSGFRTPTEIPDSVSMPSNQPEVDQQNNWQNWMPPTLFTPLPSATYNNINSQLSSLPPSGSASGQYPAMDNTQSELLMDIKVDPSDSSLVDLGMMMTGESGMDEQWMSFMRDSGILQMNNGIPLYTSSPPSYSGNQPQGYWFIRDIGIVHPSPSFYSLETQFPCCTLLLPE